MAELVFIEGTEAGKRHPLTADATVLGRHSNCDLVVTGPAVSGTHCRIEKTAEGYRVVDLGSTNGTFVNGQRVESQGLRNQDVLKLGSTPLRIEGDDLPASPDGLDPARTTGSLARAQIRPRTLADATPVSLPKDFGKRRDSRRNWKVLTLVVLLLTVVMAAYFAWQFFGAKSPL